MKNLVKPVSVGGGAPNEQLNLNENSKSEDCIHVCLSSDNNYAKYLAVTMVSIMENANKSDKLVFHILDGGIEKETSSLLKNLGLKYNAEIKFYDVKKEQEFFKKFDKGDNHLSTATYSRFLIADIIKDIDKIIYLDCDIFVETSLKKLYATDITDYYIAGVEDIGYTYCRKYRVENFIHDFTIINAGVLLINLQKWKTHNIGEKLINYSLKGENIGEGADQPVINVVCKYKRLFIDYKWNVQDSFYREIEFMVTENKNCKKIITASKRPAIIHFTGPIKPWHSYISLPKGWLYMKYIEKTPWKDECLIKYSDYKKEHKKAHFIYCIRRPFAFLKKMNSGEKEMKIIKYSKLLSDIDFKLKTKLAAKK